MADRHARGKRGVGIDSGVPSVHRAFGVIRPHYFY